MSSKQIRREQRSIRRQVHSGYPFQPSGTKKDQIQDKQIESVKKKVQKINKIFELKFLDTQASISPATTGTFQLLNGMAQGQTAITRTGNDMYATSIQWRMRVVSDVDAVAAGFCIRHIIFWDSQANAVAPVLADLLDLSTITSQVLAPYNRYNQKRFKIIEDKSFTLNPNMATTTTPATGVVASVFSPRIMSQGKRSLSRGVKYIGTGATIASIASNSLYSVMISDANVEVPIVQMGYRYFAKDG